MKKNCWEVLNCGREIGGVKVQEMGVCPASKDTTADGLNGGKNGGRICWAISGTFCGGQVQGTHAQKQATCMACEVYRMVQSEEPVGKFKMMKPGQQYKAA